MAFLAKARGICDGPQAHEKRRRSSHRWTHEEVKQALERNALTIEKAKGYDCMYVANMAYSDFYPKPLSSEAQIMQYVKAYIDDPGWRRRHSSYEILCRLYRQRRASDLGRLSVTEGEALRHTRLPILFDLKQSNGQYRTEKIRA